MEKSNTLRENIEEMMSGKYINLFVFIASLPSPMRQTAEWLINKKNVNPESEIHYAHQAFNNYFSWEESPRPIHPSLWDSLVSDLNRCTKASSAESLINEYNSEMERAFKENEQNIINLPF